MHPKRFKLVSPFELNKYNLDSPAYFRAWALAFIIIAILVNGCSMVSDEANDPPTTKKEIPMAQTSESAVSAATIPPIDAVAYARVETATFALG
jgi:hypothetical protein